MSENKYDSFLEKLLSQQKWEGWRRIAYDAGEITVGEKSGFEKASAFLESGNETITIHLAPDESVDPWYASVRLDFTSDAVASATTRENLKKKFRHTLTMLDDTGILRFEELQNGEGGSGDQVNLYYVAKARSEQAAEEFLSIFLGTLKKDIA